MHPLTEIVQLIIMKQKFEKQNKMVKIYFSEFIANVQF